VIFQEDLVEPSPRCVWFESDEDAATLASFDGQDGGLHVGHLDGEETASETRLLAGIGAALTFPAPPADFDALTRGLRDLSWLPPGAVAVGVRNADALWRAAPRTTGALVERWLEAAEDWAARGRALHLLFLWGPDASL
jgi:hypothetical protein